MTRIHPLPPRTNTLKMNERLSIKEAWLRDHHICVEDGISKAFVRAQNRARQEKKRKLHKLQLKMEAAMILMQFKNES